MKKAAGMPAALEGFPQSETYSAATFRGGSSAPES